MPTDVEWNTHCRDEPCEAPDVASLLVGAPTAVVIDLEPILGVTAAVNVSARGLAAVVLVLPRWPHAEAVLPTVGLVDTLVDGANTLRTKPGAANVVFVLDGERARSIRRPAGDPRIDNRYDVSAGDLPNLRQLRAAGIHRVVKVSHVAPMS